MTAHLAALRRARRAVLIAHTVKTVFALALLGDFWLGLVHVANDGDLVHVVRHFLQEGLGHLGAAVWVAFAYVIAGPVLTQYVLAALAGRDRPVQAALQRYGRALGLAMLRLGACGATVIFAWAFAHPLAMRAPPELETVARLIPLALGGGALLWLSTAHDAAAAQLAGAETPRVTRSLAVGARASSPGLALAHLAFLLGATLAHAAGEAGSRVLLPSLGFMLAQALALGAAFVNAAWLFTALTRTSRPIDISR